MKILKSITPTIFIIAFSVAILPVFTFSQTASSSNGSSVNSLNIINCFDYYHFGDVGVSVNLEKESTLGKPLNAKNLPTTLNEKSYIFKGVNTKFNGKITNTESYPIVNGAVFVKVFRKVNPSVNSSTVKNDNLLIDQFYAARGINVGAKGQTSFSFDWQVPKYITAGEYYIASYFLSGKFNVSGFPETDSVAGGISDFTVIGEDKEGIAFNKNSVRVDGKKYSFTADSPRVNDLNPIKITFSLSNRTDSQEKIPVSYILYGSDNLETDTILDTTSELAVISGGSSKEFSYTISDKNHAVYYLVVEARYKDTKSIIGVRVLRNNLNKLEVGYATVGNYPYKSGTENLVMACVRNITSGNVNNGKVVLSVLNKNGKKLWSGNYEGPINGAMIGLSGLFKSGNISDFSIKAEIFDGEKIVDQAILTYACKTIDSKLCSSSLVSSVWFVPVMVILIVVVLFLIFTKLEKRRRDNDPAMMQ